MKCTIDELKIHSVRIFTEKAKASQNFEELKAAIVEHGELIARYNMAHEIYSVLGKDIRDSADEEISRIYEERYKRSFEKLAEYVHPGEEVEFVNPLAKKES